MASQNKLPYGTVGKSKVAKKDSGHDKLGEEEEEEVKAKKNLLPQLIELRGETSSNPKTKELAVV